jgi:glucokinase
MPTPHRPIVGVDLGGTNINVGIIDDQLRLVRGSRVNKKTQAAQGVKVVLDRIAAAVRESMVGAGLSARDLHALGIAAAGAVDSARGVVLKGGNLGFTNVPLAAELRKRLGLRVIVENDVNAAVYGEWVHPRGAIHGARDAAGVWIGTGIGGGLIFSGKLYSGGYFTAGEIGHMTYIPGAPFGRRSLEQNCSRTAICDRLLALVASGHPSVLAELVAKEKEQLLAKAKKDLKEKGKLTWQFESNKLLRSKSVSEAYKSGDKLTVRVIHEAAHMLGTAIGGVVTLLSLPHVVLGGGFTEALGAPWVREVRVAVKECVFPPELRSVEVVGTRLKDLAGVTGAALLARDALGR